MRTLTEIELNAELRPEGVLEAFFASQILRNMLRLERYETLEENPDLEKARFRVGTFLRRDLAELRRLQSERQVRASLDSGLTGLASTKELVQVARAAVKPSGRSKNEPDEAAIRDIEARLDAHFARTDDAELSEMKKRSQSGHSTLPHPVTGRNSACPCGSGEKYKRCCGVTAPPKRNLSPQKASAAAKPLVNAPPVYLMKKTAA